MNVIHCYLIIWTISCIYIYCIKFLIVKSLGCVIHWWVKLRSLILLALEIHILIFKNISLLSHFIIFDILLLYSILFLNLTMNISFIFWQSAIILRIKRFLKNWIFLLNFNLFFIIKISYFLNLFKSFLVIKFTIKG